MKLHHFISAKVSDANQHVRNLGKALSPEISPVREPVPYTQSVAEARKKASDIKTEPTDKVEAMRDFAVSQLEGSSCHSAHHKIKHYD